MGFLLNNPAVGKRVVGELPNRKRQKCALERSLIEEMKGKVKEMIPL